jgi:hypothetical protein
MNQSELITAYSILFGQEDTASSDYLRNLDLSTIKSAYRKRVFETHPDRSLIMDIPFPLMEEKFKEVSGAYETMLRYAMHNKVHTRPFDTSRKGAWNRRGFHQWHMHRGHDFTASGNPYDGDIPQRRLFIGQYLYYSGIITRINLGAALAWQKMRRPILGQIARKWNWLDLADIRDILSCRENGERFGESAKRYGFLESYQIITLLGRQRILQPRIGEYFISRGMLGQNDLIRAEQDLRRHNKKYWK